MEQDIKLPEYLSLQGNPSENWRRWIQRFELYLLAKEKTKKPDPTKIAMLLSAVGLEALERYNHFEWREGEDKNKFDHVKAKFEKEFAGQKRIVFSRYQFWDSSRTAGQTFVEFSACLLEVRSLLNLLIHGVLKLIHQVLIMLHQMDKVGGQLEQ